MKKEVKDIAAPLAHGLQTTVDERFIFVIRSRRPNHYPSEYKHLILFKIFMTST
jgi:hypothetical protein